MQGFWLDAIAAPQVKSQQLQKACQQAPQTDVWTEPSGGLTSTVLDHAEEALRRCFEKTKEGREP